MFCEKEFIIDGERVIIRPLNFHELMVKVPASVGRIAKKMEGKEISADLLIQNCAEELFSLLSLITKKSKEFWEKVPADQGIEILTCFLEMNLTENFFKTLPRLIEVGKQIGLRLSSGSLPTATE